MSTDRQVALDYLSTPPGAPWSWADGGRALVWRDGATIAFREELALVFEKLSPGALPSFSQLVCLLAACRGRYPEPPGAEESERDKNQTAPPGFTGLLSRRADQLALDQLRALATLPRDLIGNPRGKALLAQLVLEASDRSDGPEATRVAEGLKAGLSERELNAHAVWTEAAAFDARGLLHRTAQALRGHSADSLRLRLRTGLDSLPAAPKELVLPRAERARRLLAKLAESTEHEGLALVARDLLAALRLPRVLSRVDEQASEGAAGLGNRGTLDRLLLSELAHDDLTLATRVALNEALYLHREPPARKPRHELALLLDCGLRMWGVPRLLGTAAALALLAGWPDEAGARVWRAEGEEVVPVDILDNQALAGQLAALAPDLHPGEALPAFARALQTDPAQSKDVVVITHPGALRMPEFRLRLALLEAARIFVVLVESSGLVRLHALPSTGDGGRPLVELRIDPERLRTGRAHENDAPASSTPRAPLVDPKTLAGLPAIFRVQPFPLLLPVTGKLERTTPVGEGGLCVTEDRRLLQWSRAGHGARQLLADLPGARTCFLDGTENGGILVVRGRDGSGKMAVIGLGAGETTPNVTRIVGPHVPLGVYLERGALLVIMHTRAAAVTPDGANLLGESPMPDTLRPIGGRYAIGPSNLWFASWDGTRVRWEKTDISRHVAAEKILCAFERDGVGPWVVTRDQRILGPAGNEWMQLGFEPGAVSVLRGGEELLIVSAGKNSARHFVHLKSRVCRPIPRDRVSANPAVLLQPPARQLLSRVDAIHAEPGQRLRLRKAKGGWMEIVEQREGLWLTNSTAPARALDAAAKRFESISAPSAIGCTLRRALWPDGSSAWMDDRGLLHLRSQNTHAPEFSLVLCVGQTLAGWSSVGAPWGPEFFTGTKVSGSAGGPGGLINHFTRSLPPC